MIVVEEVAVVIGLRKAATEQHQGEVVAVQHSGRVAQMPLMQLMQRLREQGQEEGAEVAEVAIEAAQIQVQEALQMGEVEEEHQVLASLEPEVPSLEEAVVVARELERPAGWAWSEAFAMSAEVVVSSQSGEAALYHLFVASCLLKEPKEELAVPE